MSDDVAFVVNVHIVGCKSDFCFHMQHGDSVLHFAAYYGAVLDDCQSSCLF